MQAIPATAPMLPAQLRPAGLVTPIARIEALRGFEAAAPVWRSLQSGDNLMTPYQRYEVLAAWHRHLGAAVEPLIIVGYDQAERPLLLCPFGIDRRHGLRIASFLGGSHSNFNMPIWRRTVADAVDAPALQDLLRRIGEVEPAIDLLALNNQPESWDGVRNPFAKLPHQPSPSFAYSGPLAADFEQLARSRMGSSSRKKLKRKERELAQHGAVRALRAATEAEREEIRRAFFVQKAARMAELGIDNAFARPGTAEFVAELAGPGKDGGTPPIDLFALKAGDTIVATFAGMSTANRFCGMFNSMTDGPLAVCSPGELLLNQVVRMACERGLTTFDLGIGEAGYKKVYCPDTEPLFDSYLPLSRLGQIAAAAARAACAAKRTIKQQPALWKLVTAWRRAQARTASAD